MWRYLNGNISRHEQILRIHKEEALAPAFVYILYALKEELENGRVHEPSQQPLVNALSQRLVVIPLRSCVVGSAFIDAGKERNVVQKLRALEVNQVRRGSRSFVTPAGIQAPVRLPCEHGQQTSV